MIPHSIEIYQELGDLVLLRVVDAIWAEVLQRSCFVPIRHTGPVLTHYLVEVSVSANFFQRQLNGTSPKLNLDSVSPATSFATQIVDLERKGLPTL